MDIKKEADISEDGLYRYRLTRRWDKHKKPLVFCMLNPSTADDKIDDPTIRRCIGFAQREGAGGIVIVNVFAFRATNPKDLMRAPAPIGEENYSYLTKIAKKYKKVIVAWGAYNNKYCSRIAEILHNYGAKLYCLGRTKNGSPRHPLYIKADQPLIEY